MKRLLIISPHFPPVNAADMQRVRQSLPYLRDLGWEAEVIAVDPQFVEAYSLDPLLQRTVPAEVPVHWVTAWPAEKTRRWGLGSLAMRSYFQIRSKGNELLRRQRFDLVLFSTTAFPVMALGPVWKRAFGVPFVLDIQDPWRNDFYLDRPKAERPPKHRFAYTLNKWLERWTAPKADGVMAVSGEYIRTLRKRYPAMEKTAATVIPFGVSAGDFTLAAGLTRIRSPFKKEKTNLVYIGRGGHDLHLALQILFRAFQKGLSQCPRVFENVHFWFFGTDYAPPGKGRQTVLPVAAEAGVGNFVTEKTDRLPYFETLALLTAADGLVIPGSTDRGYTASKIYPYILAGKPLLALFHEESSTSTVIRETAAGAVISFAAGDRADTHVEACLQALESLLGKKEPATNWAVFERYTAKARTAEQTAFFQQILEQQ